MLSEVQETERLFVEELMANTSHKLPLERCTRGWRSIVCCEIAAPTKLRPFLQCPCTFAKVAAAHQCDGVAAPEEHDLAPEAWEVELDPPSRCV